MLDWKYTENTDRAGNAYNKRVTYVHGSIFASIVKGHIYYPNDFVLHCSVFNFDTLALHCSSFEEAQAAAEKLLRDKATALVADLQPLIT